MHQTPAVTILMPVYNAAAYLRDAIDSILKQTFSDFEFLIIDDGSTDESVQIIKNYEDTRIVLIQNENNLGISKTLNRGIELAKSELIARMDADDISYPERIKKQFEYMLAHPECGLLSTWARVITHDKKVVRLEKYPHQFYYYNLNFECWIYHPTVMYRRSVVREAGLYSKPYSEDYDLFWKIARNAFISNLDEPLLDYRLSLQSLNTVLKKAEYEVANRENVIRNLRFYLGQNFQIREEYLECLRHNFAPLLALNDTKNFMECLDILNEITVAIKKTPNVNLKPTDIDGAAFHKRDFIIEQLFMQSTGFQRFIFIFKARKPQILYRKIEKSLRWRFNSIKQQFQAVDNL